MYNSVIQKYTLKKKSRKFFNMVCFDNLVKDVRKMYFMVNISIGDFIKFTAIH